MLRLSGSKTEQFKDDPMEVVWQNLINRVVLSDEWRGHFHVGHHLPGARLTLHQNTVHRPYHR